jgi:polynucleotide 5'-hydroxyl-kinase GRC3/NOL9
LDIDVPAAWERIAVSAIKDLVLVVGAPDTGKSTYARYLYRRLCAYHECVAFIDGDMGQATLGPPTTMTVALGNPGEDAFPPAWLGLRVFVGHISPRRHMLPTLVGAHKLVQRAREGGASAIVFDTTGLVDPDQGGDALKRAKIDLLQPTLVVGLQRHNELEHLLVPLRRSRRTHVIDLPVSRAVRRRSVSERREHRASGYRAYFAEARSLKLVWQEMAVVPAAAFATHRLLALTDADGFALALGTVLSTSAGTVTVHTPLASADGVDALRLGDLALDPETFSEERF